MLVLPEGQAGKYGMLPKKQCSIGNVESLYRENFEGVNATNVLNNCTVQR
jgi:hypothetical protein